MDKKKRLIIILGVVVIVAIALILIAMQDSQSAALASYDNRLVPQSILSALAIPNNVSNNIGMGLVQGSPSKINSSAPLQSGGKPEILYMGAEYCPYCAAERWPMVIALMRFGTFSNLHLMTSSASDAFPSTPTFTFYNSTYTSQYIKFVSVEMTINKLVNGTYPTLQNPNNTENNIMKVYDVPTQTCPYGGCIPFIDFANRSVQIGASYNPQALTNLDWNQIAENLSNSSNVQTRYIVGTANLFTAEICILTNNTPASVCSEPYVTSIESKVS